jgi:hypothetical protein
MIAAVVGLLAVTAFFLLRNRRPPETNEPVTLDFFFAKNPTAELLRINADEPVELNVKIRAPAYVYVFDSHESTRPFLLWQPGPDDERFEAGEYASEGVSLEGAGSHLLVAVASPERLANAENIESTEPDALQKLCPRCGIQRLTVEKLQSPAATQAPEG